MGLDMYLTARLDVYPSLYEGHGELQDALRKVLSDASVDGGAMPAEKDYPNLGQVKGVTMRVGYWRKANSIHKWFVDNAQGGEDECRPHDVGREQLVELRDLCKSILAMPEGKERDRHAETVLPPQSGFFFGNSEVGPWYYDDLIDTVRMLDNALALPDSWDFIYQSSW